MMPPDESDVIVVGAGPAGLNAAKTVSELGLSVVLIDEQADAGGQIWRNASRMVHRDGPLTKSYSGAAKVLTALDSPGVEYLPGATVLDAAKNETTGGAQIRINWLTTTPGQSGIRETHARALILATGAMERPVLFPGATLPGVMGVGAVQSILKQSGMVPMADGLVLAGQGPLLLVTLSQILDLGGTVDAVLDLSPKGAVSKTASTLLPALLGDPALMAHGAALLWRAHGSKVPWYRGVVALRALGDAAIEEIEFEHAGGRKRLPCTVLAVHDGVIPNTQLTRLLNLDHDWNTPLRAFLPRCTAEGRTSASGIWAAGDGAGIAGVEVARIRGTLTGIDVAWALGVLSDPAFKKRADPLLRRLKKRRPARTFVDKLFAPLPVTALSGPKEEDTIVCRCEAVSLARIQAAIRDGATGPNRVKTFTRCGMGACQGRMCGNALTRIVSDATGASPIETGALRVRPPLKPTLISDYLSTETPEGSES